MSKKIKKLTVASSTGDLHEDNVTSKNLGEAVKLQPPKDELAPADSAGKENVVVRNPDHDRTTKDGKDGKAKSDDMEI